VSDTACDLPSRTTEELGIALVPLHVRFGATELVDRVELSTADFWQRAATCDELPSTAAPSPGAFADAFRSAAESGADGVVCVTLSSRVSATYEAAAQGAREAALDVPVVVVDSLSVTMGEGMVALAAAEAAARGSGVDGVVAAAESTKRRVAVYGAIDTLENLRKGGRIGNARAVLGTLLSIKPVIEIRDGVVEEESRQRTRARALRYLADKVRAAGPLQRLALLNGNAPDFDAFVELLSDVTPATPLVTADIGPVVAAHAGPGAVGVAWERGQV
jgi:DegV family protein with EDD domain